MWRIFASWSVVRTDEGDGPKGDVRRKLHMRERRMYTLYFRPWSIARQHGRGLG